ncbi:MAG TPA: efflux transporter outer membrane subunit [Bacteroidia bacterium]|nr:efflux transporter outer membrane subunit [Bacteroidia bacterium]
MMRNKIAIYLGITGLSFIYTACMGPSAIKRAENKNVPTSFYSGTKDTLNSATIKWKTFFTDQNLVALIDTALKNNQELNIIMQEINIAKNDVRAKKGAYIPNLEVGIEAGVDKSSRYTIKGANEEANDIVAGQKNPESLANYLLGANISWEIDIWGKLRNAKKAAVFKYLSSIDGKNFMVTHLVAEIANSYYELLALDNQLDILKKNIELYQNSLEIVKLEKNAARVTELAVRRFEAEVLKNQSRQFYIEQQIVMTENHINYLLGRFPQPITRSSSSFLNQPIDTIHSGIPSQLLENRPDIKKAERELIAAKLDVKSAKAEFYPALKITAGAGYSAFNPQYIIETPLSLIYNVAGNLVAPLINRNAIKANYLSSTSKQVQAMYNYERTILNAHIEVANQISNISNLKKSFELKNKQIQTLTESIDISNTLFKSARADYMEVLLTQRDALESKFELIETKKQQMNAMVNVFEALGGGWR